MAYAIGTKTDCDAIKVARDDLMGAPVKGCHVGGGRHVDMPASWDGQGGVPPGWSGYAGPVESASTPGQWGVDVGEGEVSAALINPVTASKVPQSEKTTLQNAIATAVPADQFATATKADTQTKGG